MWSARHDPMEYIYWYRVQWFYFKTTHGTLEFWSYIAGGLKMEVD